MPIIVGGSGLPPTSPPVQLPDVGRAHAVYLDPRGGVWPLTDPAAGWFTPSGAVAGLGAAPVELATDAHPRGGARLRHVQPQARDITWGLHVWGDTHDELTGRWRTLARAFTDTLRYGPGAVEIARPDGDRRQIAVYYRGGFESDGDMRLDASAAISLWCEDPYWTDPVPITEHRAHTGGNVSFFTNFFQLSSGRTLGSTTLTNPGDVIAYPTWTITGPASLITFTHVASGASFALNPSASAIGHGALLAGQQVTIRTDPIQVRYQNGDNWTGGLNWPAASLWGLQPGENEVTFQLDGASTGSAVDVEFHARYETA